MGLPGPEPVAQSDVMPDLYGAPSAAFGGPILPPQGGNPQWQRRSDNDPGVPPDYSMVCPFSLVWRTPLAILTRVS